MSGSNATEPLPANLGGYAAGMTWGWTGVRGTWAVPAAEQSLDALGALGGNWITVAFAAEQATAQSTTIPFGQAPTVTDDEVRWAIRAAKARGLLVCLKPVVNVADGTWRAHIGFFDLDVPGEPSWGEWFAAYTEFLVHYAELAEQEGVELFCVGCEMVRADARDAEWRATIAAVREVYSGPLTYNCDKYQEDRLSWWDAVDVISSSGYYPTGTWQEHLDRIEPVVRRHGKPFLFLEAGCPSRDTSPTRPNDWALPGEPSGAAQADYYREVFAACDERDWVGGFMFWDWPAALYPAEAAAENTDYCVFGKPAAAVVAEHYRARAAGSSS